MMGNEWQLSVNEINATLEMIDVTKMITLRFEQTVKQIPALPKEEWNKMWAIVARKEEFNSSMENRTSLRPRHFACARGFFH